jgi:hypothetical protein
MRGKGFKPDNVKKVYEHGSFEEIPLAILAGQADDYRVASQHDLFGMAHLVRSPFGQNQPEWHKGALLDAPGKIVSGHACIPQG